MWFMAHMYNILIHILIHCHIIYTVPDAPARTGISQFFCPSMTVYRHELEHAWDFGNTVVAYCAFSRSSELIMTSSYRNVKMWNARTGEPVSTSANRYLCRVKTHHRLLMASVVDDTVEIWDPTTETCVCALSRVTKHMSCCALSPDGVHLAIWTPGSAITIWDIKTDTHVRTIQMCHDYLWVWHGSCGYSSDGSLFACVDGEKYVQVWDQHNGSCIRVFPENDDGYHIYDCQFSPRDDTLLATASSNRIVKLWNARTGVCLDMLLGHEASVCKLAFFPDGVYLATMSSDKTTRIWDVYIGICVHVVQHNQLITCIDISPDGSMLATSSLYSGTAHTWNIPSRLRNNVKLLLMMLAGKCRLWWLPAELWDWINAQWFFYQASTPIQQV